MDTEALVATFREAGLSPYQASTYVALLDLGTASATELAEAAEVPSARIYDVLRDLESRGYIETYEREHRCARAHSPAQVLADLRERATEFEAAAEEVEARWEQPDVKSPRASLVHRFDTVLDRARTCIERATHQVQLSVSESEFGSLRGSLRAARERGAAVNVVVHTDPDAPAPERARFEGICSEVRHRPLPAPFVALVDRHQTCFAHHADSVDRYGVLVDDRAHTYVFNWYFQTCLWEPWPVVHSDGEDGLPREYVDLRRCLRDVTPALADGATVRVTVEGRDLTSGDPRTIRGDVVDVRTASEVSGATPSLRDLAGRATLVVDDGERTHAVGGWGAVVEEVEATRITVDDIDWPSDR
ncbi:TrmB family transcriptional regulator [Halomarina ordinaria]|uniref:TrmB family transcriptional regulator n=1 Tax=Halomarina ordinaria TaxID=3033939 RepID=A0ABD5U8I2_9EURY|nr:TrmB family transcriptional regulator sugar-binding domain-containing protein [Halomarina sp. PSRA2]